MSIQVCIRDDLECRGRTLHHNASRAAHKYRDEIHERVDGAHASCVTLSIAASGPACVPTRQGTREFPAQAPGAGCGEGRREVAGWALARAGPSHYVTQHAQDGAQTMWFYFFFDFFYCFWLYKFLGLASWYYVRCRATFFSLSF